VSPVEEAIARRARHSLKSFATVTGLLRDWAHYRRLAELSGVRWPGGEESGERTLRVWAAIDHGIADPFEPGFVRFREEWDTGMVRRGNEWDGMNNWPLLNAGWIANGRVSLVGESTIAGRAVDLVEVDPKHVGLLIADADRERAAVDCERGILLRAESLLGDEVLLVEEFLEIAFDEEIDPALLA
jgi:hypothetical protein